MNPNLLNNIYMMIFLYIGLRYYFYLYIYCIKSIICTTSISLYWLMVLAIAQFS